MAFRLPLFPLNVVLFPDAPMPLHIFEPRYRQLLSDCAEGDRRFGLCLPGGEQSMPAAGTIGTVAEIVEAQALPDGRSNILVEGRERFRIVELLDEGTPYLTALVEPYEERPGSVPDPEELDRLRVLFRRYADLVGRLTDRDASGTEPFDDPTAFSFQASAGIECDLGVKHRLLVLRSTAERVTLLLRIVPQLLGPLEEAVVVRERAATNGKGGHHSDLPTS